MTLVEIFTDYVVNKKSLREYVEVRKTINARGEFNDISLIQAQENLDRLKEDDREIYDEMYNVLNTIIREDCGHPVEYSIDFIRAILKMYKANSVAKNICNEYKQVLEHCFNDS